jgi:hypothetical protein
MSNLMQIRNCWPEHRAFDVIEGAGLVTQRSTHAAGFKPLAFSG